MLAELPKQKVRHLSPPCQSLQTVSSRHCSGAWGTPRTRPLPLAQELSLPLDGGEPELLRLSSSHLLVRLPGGPLSITDVCSGRQVDIEAQDLGDCRNYALLSWWAGAALPCLALP